ncbi:MAG: Txe/YoeB family addiction module toxin [Taibaiella sp.]|nr:Txe/YoeB family addiction module toxin [Taibaiella sp.]
MEVIFMPAALEDVEFWKKSGNVIILKRIRQLIEAIQEEPFAGIGKPERLKYNWSEWWSRRINDEHRIVYKVESDKIIVYSVRYHYQK